MALKCSNCGNSGDNVFFELIEYNGKYTVNPICIKCKTDILKNKINTKQINSITKWENDLKILENTVATSIINDIFSDIKFKNQAKKELISLMRKYSVRTVFEVCHTYNFKDFSKKLIENKIQSK